MPKLSWTHSVLDIPDGGLAIDRMLSDEERADLATELEIEAVDRVKIKGRLRSASAGTYHLEGKIFAVVAQACVVSLEPVAEVLTIPLAIDFMPETLMPPPIPDVAEDDDVAPEKPIAEPIVNGRIDLGEVVFQEIAAALNPYPRLEDAELDATEAAPKDSEGAHPFAKLRDLNLKKRET